MLVIVDWAWLLQLFLNSKTSVLLQYPRLSLPHSATKHHQSTIVYYMDDLHCLYRMFWIARETAFDAPHANQPTVPIGVVAGYQSLFAATQCWKHSDLHWTTPHAVSSVRERKYGCWMLIDSLYLPPLTGHISALLPDPCGMVCAMYLEYRVSAISQRDSIIVVISRSSAGGSKLSVISLL
jgi:hypothetical protein